MSFHGLDDVMLEFGFKAGFANATHFPRQLKTQQEYPKLSQRPHQTLNGSLTHDCATCSKD